MGGSGFVLVLIGILVLWLGITGRFDAVVAAVKGAVEDGE